MNWSNVETSVTGEWPRPRLHYVPNRPADRTLATEGLQFVEQTGYLLDPWQAFETEQSLLTDAESPNLTWLCTEFGWLAPRQNGKGGVITARSLISLFHLPCYDQYGRRKPRLVVYTAHQFKTAREAFIRMRDVIDGSDMLRRQMKKDRSGGIRNAAGEEGFELANGNRLRYLARSTGGSGRGLSIDDLFTDEGQELPRSAWDALKYTQRAMPNPQRLITGTVPEPANNHEVWTMTRDRGRRGQSHTSGWSEYSPDPDDEQTKFDMTKPAHTGHDVDPDLRYALATNPAFGIRISARQLLDDADGDAESYKREVCCWWPDDGASERVLRNWSELRDRGSEIVEATVGVQYAWDLSWASVAVAGPRSDNLMGVEMIDYRPGTEWVPGYLAEVNEKVRPRVFMVDVGGPTSLLASDVETLELDLPMYPMKLTELAQACYRVYTLVKDKGLRYRRHIALDSAALAAEWRKLGQMRAFNLQTTAEASPLLAVSLAVYGAWTGAVVPEKPADKKVPQPSHRVYGFN